MFSVSSNIEIIRDTVDRADRIVQDLLIDISEIAMGKIPPHLLPPDLLVEGLQAVSIYYRRKCPSFRPLLRA